MALKVGDCVIIPSNPNTIMTVEAVEFLVTTTWLDDNKTQQKGAFQAGALQKVHALSSKHETVI